MNNTKNSKKIDKKIKKRGRPKLPFTYPVIMTTRGPYCKEHNK